MRPNAPASAYTWLPLALLAIVAPTLVAAHDPPSVTFYNQALALFGWGLWTAALAGLVLNQVPTAGSKAQGAMWAMATVLSLNAGLAMLAHWVYDVPLGLSLMGAGLPLAGLVVFVVAWKAGLSLHRDAIFDVFCEALTWAGLAGMALALIQVFHPAWTDGMWIAEPTMPGRAVGNLRQPNHFSTLLAWSCCAAAWLGARQKWALSWSIVSMMVMIAGVVLTASRTGMLTMLLLTLWGWRDRSLPLRLRQALMLAPLVYAAWWGGMWLWSHADSSVSFAAEARLHDHSDISSSRFKIWANVLDLIAQHPWTGVGYGEFNLAWTLTSFPNRPVAFFDHTHNLLLQWAVEFGVPLTLLMIGLCAWAWWSLLRPGLSRQAEPKLTPTWATAVIVSIVGLHSMLEYPLWYSYFLLPAAFAWGIGLASPAPSSTTRAETTSIQASRVNPWLARGAIGISLMTAWCAWDYQAAANIYAPRPWAGPLEERIQFGQRMTWFSYQADYADVTGTDTDEDSKPPAAFKQTLHNLLDVRLMEAYARSLAEHGEIDKARFVVARMKEFRPGKSAFLAACDKLKADETAPFQCLSPQKTYAWRELLPN